MIMALIKAGRACLLVGIIAMAVLIGYDLATGEDMQIGLVLAGGLVGATVGLIELERLRGQSNITVPPGHTITITKEVDHE